MLKKESESKAFNPFYYFSSEYYGTFFAVKEAAKIYRHIESVKEKDNFITEVSMDESDTPQSPVEMLFILLMYVLVVS